MGRLTTHVLNTTHGFHGCRDQGRAIRSMKTNRKAGDGNHEPDGRNRRWFWQGMDQSWNINRCPYVADYHKAKVELRCLPRRCGYSPGFRWSRKHYHVFPSQPYSFNLSGKSSPGDLETPEPGSNPSNNKQTPGVHLNDARPLHAHIKILTTLIARVDVDQTTDN